MDKQHVAWSHSALHSFETCPRRHNLTKVVPKNQRIIEPETDELRWGKKAHKCFELRLKNQAPLPKELAHFEPVANRLAMLDGKKVIEGQLAINAKFQPVGWFDKDVWCRAVLDVGVIRPEVAIIGDWKTGKRKPDSDQLALSAAMAFAHFPFLKRVHTWFAWLKDNKLDAEVFTHLQVGELWSTFLPRVKRLEIAHERGQWEPKPSGLCGKWCPVTKAHCEFGR